MGTVLVLVNLAVLVLHSVIKRTECLRLACGPHLPVRVQYKYTTSTGRFVHEYAQTPASLWVRPAADRRKYLPSVDSKIDRMKINSNKHNIIFFTIYICYIWYILFLSQIWYIFTVIQIYTQERSIPKAHREILGLGDKNAYARSGFCIHEMQYDRSRFSIMTLY